MPGGPDLLSPSARRRGNWGPLLASVVTHLVLLSIPGAYLYRTAGELPDVQLLRLDPVVTQVDITYYRERTPVRPPPTVDLPDPVAPEGPATPAAAPVAAPTGIPRLPLDTGAARPRPAAPGPVAGQGGLRPALGEGHLWVQPLPLAPNELAQRLTRSHIELIDSAVTSIVQAYLDSVITAPTPFDNRPPSWTTEIAGRTFGIDSRFIHLGGLKIPTAILALLPIPQAGTVDLRQAHRMAQMREDLMYAAQRSRTMEDFKRAVREIREEQDRQREFERNQRRDPSDTAARRPPSPPPPPTGR